MRLRLWILWKRTGLGTSCVTMNASSQHRKVWQNTGSWKYGSGKSRQSRQISILWSNSGLTYGSDCVPWISEMPWKRRLFSAKWLTKPGSKELSSLLVHRELLGTLPQALLRFAVRLCARVELLLPDSPAQSVGTGVACLPEKGCFCTAVASLPLHVCLEKFAAQLSSMLHLTTDSLAGWKLCLLSITRCETLSP